MGSAGLAAIRPPDRGPLEDVPVWLTPSVVSGNGPSAIGCPKRRSVEVDGCVMLDRCAVVER